MKWFNWLFKEDTTPATEEYKKLYISLLQECEAFYKHFEDIPQYKQYVEAFKEMQEESSFIATVTQMNIEKLIRLLQARRFGLYSTMHYPGAEKVAIQYLLAKEKKS